MNKPTIEQSAVAINQVRATATEETVNQFLVAIERHYGSEHMRAAHAMAHNLLHPAQAEEPAPYRQFGKEIAEWKNGMYRFYCYPSSWAISPAARSGAVLVTE